MAFPTQEEFRKKLDSIIPESALSDDVWYAGQRTATAREVVDVARILSISNRGKVDIKVLESIFQALGFDKLQGDA